jgi:chromosomal replication initiator protein
LAESFWEHCLASFREHPDIDEDVMAMLLNPLTALDKTDGLHLFAPNQYIVDKINQNIMPALKEIIGEKKFFLAVGSPDTPQQTRHGAQKETAQKQASHLNPNFRFDTFIEGPSNRLAMATAMQVALSPHENNPFFIYGSTGLGKTHLAHATGHAYLAAHPNRRVLYVHSERFVNDMISALQRNNIVSFKQKYRDVDLLIVDDIQFFAGKKRTEEEFFHTFNTLMEAEKQMILTADVYPKELQGLESRLRSRFSWGLTVGVEPPDLETMVAILIQKAEAMGVQLDQNVAFFIAGVGHTNVRELEGALKRVLASARFTKSKIDLHFARQVLKDLLFVQAKLISIDNIQRIVSHYYKIKTADLVGKRRTASLAKARHMAMYLSKKMTHKSYPEIGSFFGGRDHTTVLHGCRRIEKSLDSSLDIKEDFANLMRLLSG